MNVITDTANTAETDNTHEAQATQNDDVLENLTGEYAYASDYGTGYLTISKTSEGYDISDYESASSYRFLANSSNIEAIESNKIYLKYPEQVFSDGTVVFNYYILEYGVNEINVYYTKTLQEEAQFLYCASKEIPETNDSAGVAQAAQNDAGSESLTQEYADAPDYEALGIQPYEYPAEFCMGDNLKEAISDLAPAFDPFDISCVNREDWKEFFIARFIQNSWSACDYLDMLSMENDGLISVEEVNYIQYSLTNTYVDFSSEIDGFIDSRDASSPLNSSRITGYDYEYTDDGVRIVADREVAITGSSAVYDYKTTIELVKNPYSCFDGYSVISISSEMAPPEHEPDNSTHIFYGDDMMYEKDGVFVFECPSSDDGFGFTHFVDVDMTELPELAEFVRENAGKRFKVTYIWSEGDSKAISRVVPTDIELAERK
ncbi:MAG: hypothetical protein NC092_02560 [Butyrivibrio sp.]|nr:hypothetical protein [Muribaculum sp.]MCM1551555.1 hypothetical protein [Butyrivibrio sp.]